MFLLERGGSLSNPAPASAESNLKQGVEKVTSTMGDRDKMREFGTRATHGYDCWEAYVAAFSFAVGMGMVCVPASGPYTPACSVGSATLFPINWNSSCK